MIDSPVINLQHLASNPKSDIIDVLMLAKMIAVKLDLHDLTDWIEYEIEGYPEGVEIPEYRVGKGVIRYWNRVHGWQNVGFRDVHSSARDAVETFRLGQSISSLKDLKADDGELHLPIPPRFVELMFKGQEIPYQICWFFSASIAASIVVTVRNKILNWSLDLEKKGILGIGLLFTQNERRLAPMTVNTVNINGNVTNSGAIGAGNSGDINQQNSLITGDFSALERQLKEHGIDDADINELKDVIDQTPKPETKEEVEKSFGAWIGKMTGKAFTGAIKIAGAAAPVLLTNYICHHYGIPV